MQKTKMHNQVIQLNTPLSFICSSKFWACFYREQPWDLHLQWSDIYSFTVSSCTLDGTKYSQHLIFGSMCMYHLQQQLDLRQMVGITGLWSQECHFSITHLSSIQQVCWKLGKF